MTTCVTPMATVCLLIAISLASPLKTHASGDMTVFGDSSSDNGNVYTVLLQVGATPQDMPQIVDGRLTNGSNWVDYLSSALGRQASASLQGGSNYAYGGALMGFGLSPLHFDEAQLFVPSVGNVIASNTAQGLRFDGDDIVVLYAGHNDAATITTEGVVSDATQVAQELGANLENLYNSGARILVVPTLVAVENAPETIQANASQSVRNWIDEYQAKANAVIDQFTDTHPNSEVLRPDIGKLIRAIMDEPDRFGIKNRTVHRRG